LSQNSRCPAYPCATPSSPHSHCTPPVPSAADRTPFTALSMCIHAPVLVLAIFPAAPPVPQRLLLIGHHVGQKHAVQQTVALWQMFRMPIPPDSSPPIKISYPNIRSTKYLNPITSFHAAYAHTSPQCGSNILVVLNAASHPRPLPALQPPPAAPQILCESTTLSCSSIGPMRSASPSVITTQRT